MILNLAMLQKYYSGISIEYVYIYWIGLLISVDFMSDLWDIFWNVTLASIGWVCFGLASAGWVKQLASSETPLLLFWNDSKWLQNIRRFLYAREQRISSSETGSYQQKILSENKNVSILQWVTGLPILFFWFAILEKIHTYFFG